MYVIQGMQLFIVVLTANQHHVQNGFSEYTVQYLLYNKLQLPTDNFWCNQRENITTTYIQSARILYYDRNENILATMCALWKKEYLNIFKLDGSLN